MSMSKCNEHTRELNRIRQMNFRRRKREREREEQTKLLQTNQCNTVDDDEYKRLLVKREKEKLKMAKYRQRQRELNNLYMFSDNQQNETVNSDECTQDPIPDNTSWFNSRVGQLSRIKNLETRMNFYVVI